MKMNQLHIRSKEEWDGHAPEGAELYVPRMARPWRRWVINGYPETYSKDCQRWERIPSSIVTNNPYLRSQVHHVEYMKLMKTEFITRDALPDVITRIEPGGFSAGYKIETRLEDSVLTIMAHSGYLKQIVQQVIDFEDKAVRDALIKLGWTPPPDEK